MAVKFANAFGLARARKYNARFAVWKRVSQVEQCSARCFSEAAVVVVKVFQHHIKSLSLHMRKSRAMPIRSRPCRRPLKGSLAVVDR